MASTRTQPPELPPAIASAEPLSRELPKRPSESAGDAENGPGITPAQVLHALRRRWLVAVPLAASLALLVYLGAERRLTPVYTARTLIHIGPQVAVFDDAGFRADGANPQRTHIATLKSRVVRQAVVRELEPLNLTMFQTKSDPVDWLEKEIQADYSVSPETLRVTMKGSDPDQLVIVLNAVSDAYLRELRKRDHADRLARLNHLKSLSTKLEGELKAEREDLTGQTEAFGARDYPSLKEMYDDTKRRLQGLRDYLLLPGLEPEPETKPQTPKVEREPVPAELRAALEKELATDLVAGEFRKEIARLEKRLAELESRLPNYQTDDEYIRNLAQLNSQKGALERRKEMLLERLRKELQNQKPLAPERPRSALPKPEAEREIKRLELEADRLAKILAELKPVNAEITRHEEQLNVLKGKMRSLEVELQTPPRASVVEEALITETPSGSRALKLAVGPAVVSFFAVLFFVAWLDLRRGQVNGGTDLETSRIRVIGAVPSVRPNVLPAFAPPTHDRDRREYLQLTDAIDMTRAVIAPVLAAAPGYVLVVTSATAGEGKTVLSAHLAARFARSGLRTLLIDTDVRQPKIAHLLALPKGPGLGEWVTGAVRKHQIVVPGPVPGLSVISAGGCDARTVTELLDRRLPELLRTAKQHYDVIVIDTAPVLCTPESLAVSRLADGVVLSVMRDVSRLPSIQACAERLASINAHILGAVVTKDTAPSYGTY